MDQVQEQIESISREEQSSLSIESEGGNVMGLFSSIAEVAGIVATPFAITAEAVGEATKGVADEVVEPLVEAHKVLTEDFVEGLSDAVEDIKEGLFGDD